MAITAVLRPQQQQERREVKEDPMDKIIKGLQIASSVYGLKTSYEQSQLNQLRAKATEQQLEQGDIKTQAMERQAELQEAGIQTPEQVSKQYIQVTDKEGFQKRFGTDIPLVEIKTGPEPEDKILGVDRGTFSTFVSANLKQRELGLKGRELSQRGESLASQKEETRKAKDIRERTIPGIGIANSLTDAKSLKEATVMKKKFDAQLGELIQLRETFGAELANREAIGRGKQLSKDILLTYKNLAKLGVLSKSDEAIINAIVPSDPLQATVSTFIGDTRLAGGDPILNQLKSFLSDSQRDYDTRLELMLESKFEPDKLVDTTPPLIPKDPRQPEKPATPKTLLGFPLAQPGQVDVDEPDDNKFLNDYLNQ